MNEIAKHLKFSRRWRWCSLAETHPAVTPTIPKLAFGSACLTALTVRVFI
jgi:hypothetical protein